MIPIIDLFAGPGGLGEGFSALKDENGNSVFDIKLSIEKSADAIKTLTWRAFYRQFTKRNEPLPSSYYLATQHAKIKDRELAIESALDSHPYGKYARQEAQQIELGSPEWPPETVDKLIHERLSGAKNWILIGGPPCQAYSNAGRSRVGGIKKDDHRVFLYQEYLRILEVHKPAVFVMENVQGLLSSKIDEQYVFDWIKNDLTKNDNYKLFSFVGQVEKDRDYIIESNKFGIPQKRKRIILLGLRCDVKHPGSYLRPSQEVPLREVIGDLPKMRSGIGKSFEGYVDGERTKSGRPKRIYKKLENTREIWLEALRQGAEKLKATELNFNSINWKTACDELGSEFISWTNTNEGTLQHWFADADLNGVLNHEARTHLKQDIQRYQFATLFTNRYGRFPRLDDFKSFNQELVPDHKSASTGNFNDRFRVQLADEPATTITCHIAKDGHYFIHYDPCQVRSLSVREAARIQTFPDNYLFRGSRTSQYHQVGNAVPPYLAYQLAQVVSTIKLK